MPRKHMANSFCYLRFVFRGFMQRMNYHARFTFMRTHSMKRNRYLLRDTREARIITNLLHEQPAEGPLSILCAQERHWTSRRVTRPRFEKNGLLD